MDIFQEPPPGAQRPFIHYTAPQGWLNDPNGLLYHRGNYHLFFQYSPDIDRGPMHWGHARSQDLLHWETLPTALFPDENGEVFSGSLVFDENNSSGFGSTGNAPLVAVFTHDNPDGANGWKGQAQGLAYSLDGGRTFTMYDGNPVLDDPNPNFRDPKVFWHEPSQRWIMPVVRGREVCFYHSKNLKKWTHSSSFTTPNPAPGGIWECPDLSLVPVEDSAGGTAVHKWVLMVSVNDSGYYGMQYFVGDFDGSVFTAETPAKDILFADFGFDNYAMVTYNGVRDRVIAVGWMNCWHYALKVPAKDFRGSMTIPRELTLRQTPSGLRLVQKPVRELGLAFQRQTTLENVSAADLPDAGVPLLLDLILPENNATDEWRFELKCGEASFVILLDLMAGTITVDRRACGFESLGATFYRPFSAAYRPSGSGETITLLIDTTSVEVFAANGETVGTFQYFIPGLFERLTVRGGNICVRLRY